MSIERVKDSFKKIKCCAIRKMIGLEKKEDVWSY